MKLGDRITVHINSSGSLVSKGPGSFELPTTIIGVYTYPSGIRQFYLAWGKKDGMMPSAIPMIAPLSVMTNGGGYQYLADVSDYQYAYWFQETDTCIGKVLNDGIDMAVVVNSWICSLPGCKKTNNPGDKSCFMCGNKKV